MQSYFARHSPKLDVDDATRRRLWEERWVAIHYPEDRYDMIRERDSESLDPADYPPNVSQYVQLLIEIAGMGGYVLAEHYPHGDEYLVGRVDPGSQIEILRGRWGPERDRGSRPPVPGGRTGREAVLKGLRLQDARVVSRDEIEGLWEKRPRQGTLHRWPSVGDAIAQLVEGAERHPGGRVNQWERAYHVWNELANYARAKKTLAYKQLGELTGIHPIALRFPLVIIENYCLDNRLPPLTILVVNDTGRPGSGFKAYDIDRFEEGLTPVFSFDWGAYGNPFGFAANGATREEVVTQLVADPARAEDVYGRVRVRGGVQMLFRDAVLRAYGGQCAFSGSAIHQGLEAAHLVPWSESSPRERLDIRNGLLLTSWHHRLFDAGYITLAEDYRVRVDPKLLSSSSTFDNARLGEIDGSTMRLPRDPGLHPDPALIRRRNEIRGWLA